MKIHQLTLTATGLFAAAWLGLSMDTQGFSTIPGNLGAGTQRDFRVFNNFTDPAANNNLNFNINFPEYNGATLAIWKASVEWGSLLHGTGNGDPSQNGDLGSGGANFDASFQGNATSVGTTNNNIHSELGGSSGGVLAFTETPINDGWRIRYYAGWTWHDGPGVNIPGIDLQGVACHEYGHALGLGHTNVNGSTMFASVSGSGVAQRSINFDDAAGVQFKYGVIDPGKPVISAIARVGGQLVILGDNFDPTNNAVWFTQLGAGGNGTPVQLNAIPSTLGGTRIDVTVPGAAGSGDILVRNQNGGHPSLSNAFPFHLTETGCPEPTNYCVGAPHSEGSGASVNILGSQSVAANDFTLEVNGAPSNKSGIFFYGPTQIQVVFGDGFRCVGGSTQRLPVVQTDFVGFASFSPNLATASGISPGAIQNFQFWFRDPMGPGGSGFNTSDAISVFFCD